MKIMSMLKDKILNKNGIIAKKILLEKCNDSKVEFKHKNINTKESALESKSIIKKLILYSTNSYLYLFLNS